MAYRIEKRTVSDIRSGRQAIGVKIPFSSPSVFIPTYQTIDAYKTNLLNWFLTRKTERYLNTEFGSIIYEYIFEQDLDDSRKAQLEGSIRQELSYYFPKLVIDELTIDSIGDEHTLQLYLKFHIRDTYLEDELVINYE